MWKRPISRWDGVKAFTAYDLWWFLTSYIILECFSWEREAVKYVWSYMGGAGRRQWCQRCLQLSNLALSADVTSTISWQTIKVQYQSPKLLAAQQNSEIWNEIRHIRAMPVQIRNMHHDWRQIQICWLGILLQAYVSGWCQRCTHTSRTWMNNKVNSEFREAEKCSKHML